MPPPRRSTNSRIKFLLLGREVAGVDGAEDQALIAEEIFGARGEAIGEFLRAVDALAVELILGGADDGDNLHHAVVLFGLADELVFPARLALYIKDAARVVAHIDDTSQLVVGGVLLGGERLGGDLQGLGAGAADIEHHELGLPIAIGAEGDGARRQNLGLGLAHIADAKSQLAAGVSALMEGDAGGEARIGEGAGRDDGVVELDVVLGTLAAEAYGVDGNVAGAQRADGRFADAARVVVAIGEKDDGADGKVGSLLGQLLQAVAEARGGRGGLQVLEVLDAGGHVVDAVEASLKGAIEIGEDAVLQRFDGLRLTSGAVLDDGHAAGIVDHYGDDVLLRLQLGDGDARAATAASGRERRAAFARPR